MKQTIFFVDAACGGGKTTAGINVAIEHVRRGERVLMAFPSVQLVGETHNRLLVASEGPIRVHRFDGDTQRPGRSKKPWWIT